MQKKIVTFVNFSDEDFTYTWDGHPMSFKAKEAKEIEEYLAIHFAKHLVNREMNKRNLRTDHFSRQEFIEKCFVIEDEITEELKSEKKVGCDDCGSKGYRHKKDCPTIGDSLEQDMTEEFADLSE